VLRTINWSFEFVLPSIVVGYSFLNICYIWDLGFFYLFLVCECITLLNWPCIYKNTLKIHLEQIPSIYNVKAGWLRLSRETVNLVLLPAALQVYYGMILAAGRILEQVALIYTSRSKAPALDLTKLEIHCSISKPLNVNGPAENI